jgi:hypothetical protein
MPLSHNLQKPVGNFLKIPQNSSKFPSEFTSHAGLQRLDIVSTVRPTCHGAELTSTANPRPANPGPLAVASSARYRFTDAIIAQFAGDRREFPENSRKIPKIPHVRELLCQQSGPRHGLDRRWRPDRVYHGAIPALDSRPVVPLYNCTVERQQQPAARPHGPRSLRPLGLQASRPLTSGPLAVAPGATRAFADHRPLGESRTPSMNSRVPPGSSMAVGLAQPARPVQPHRREIGRLTVWSVNLQLPGRR